MSKRNIILTLIIILAASLRFYKLGQVPVSLDWDEVSMGYNAWALMTTGKDEFGNSWPLTIRSFNDYKPPLYTYLLIPSLKIFGRTEFAIRFPSALAGTLTVLATYFLIRKLFSEHSEYSVNQKFRLSEARKVRLSGAPSTPSFPNNIAIIATFLLSISPWHLQFSRIAFEANLGLFWFVTGIWLFLKSIREKNRFLILSVLSFGLGMMSYHSNRVATPIMILVLAILFKRELVEIWGRCKLLIAVSMAMILGITFLIGYTVFYQKVGQARFMETSFISTSDNGGILEYGRKFLMGYLDHYNLKFWFLNGDGVGRHRAPDFGLLYLWELPLLAAGFIGLISRSASWRRQIKLLFAWFLLAPVAAALVKGAPSAVRSLLFLPTFQIFEAVGAVWVISLIRRIGLIRRILLAAFCLLMVTFEVTYYFYQYYRRGPAEQAKDWQYGYKQLVGKLAEEDWKYEKIMVTTVYDQPYIYFLWYGNYEPGKWINNGEFNKGFDKYYFGRIGSYHNAGESNMLSVGSPSEIPEDKWLWTVNFLDGSPAFVATDYD